MPSAGNNASCQPGAMPYQIISSSSTVKDIAKSTALTSIVLAGTMRRGKYTFDSKWPFVIKLLLHSLSAFEKKNHGNNPEKTKTA
jgi:hypothetical protein